MDDRRRILDQLARVLSADDLRSYPQIADQLREVEGEKIREFAKRLNMTPAELIAKAQESKDTAELASPPPLAGGKPLSLTAEDERVLLFLRGKGRTQQLVLFREIPEGAAGPAFSRLAGAGLLRHVKSEMELPWVQLTPKGDREAEAVWAREQMRLSNERAKPNEPGPTAPAPSTPERPQHGANKIHPDHRIDESSKASRVGPSGPQTPIEHPPASVAPSYSLPQELRFLVAASRMYSGADHIDAAQVADVVGCDIAEALAFVRKATRQGIFVTPSETTE